MISTRLPTKAFRSPSLSPESSKALPSAVVPDVPVAVGAPLDSDALISTNSLPDPAPVPSDATLGEVMRLAVVVFSLLHSQPA